MENKRLVISLYLCGSIAKGHDTSGFNWDEKAILELRKAILTKNTNIELLIADPSARSDDISDPKSVVGRDLAAVKWVDFVIADLRDKRGIGVGAELMFAKMQEKPTPVIGWLRKNSNYHQDKTTVLNVPLENWIHPFIEELVDIKCFTIDEIAEAIINSKEPIKDKNSIENCIQHYTTNFIDDDYIMRHIKETK